VPLGTALGQAFSWRATFWAVTAIGLVALAGIALLLPAKIRIVPANLTREIAVLGKSQVLLAMAISALVSASLFTVFTYITPMLEEVTGLSPHGVTIALLLFGVGLTLGNVVGGRLADWKLTPSLIAILLALILVMGVLTFAIHWLPAAIATIILWGAVVFASVPVLQLKVVDAAQHAPNLASTINQGAFNLGNATGAWLGGFAILRGVGYGELPIVGALVAVAALGLSLRSLWLERRRPVAWRASEAEASQ
jgi:DHA1 family inner membrane transport protein